MVQPFVRANLSYTCVYVEPPNHHHRIPILIMAPVVDIYNMRNVMKKVSFGATKRESDNYYNSSNGVSIYGCGAEHKVSMENKNCNPAKYMGYWVRTKLNNTVQSVYTFSAVCNLLVSPAWPQ
jgi:hypothetical protein